MQYQTIRIYFDLDLSALSNKQYKEVLNNTCLTKDHKRYCMNFIFIVLLSSIAQTDIYYTKCPLYYSIFNYWFDRFVV